MYTTRAARKKVQAAIFKSPTHTQAFVDAFENYVQDWHAEAQALTPEHQEMFDAALEIISVMYVALGH